MDWRWEDRMPSEEDDGRKPWFEVGEDLFEAAKRHVMIMNEASRSDFTDGNREGFALVLLASGAAGAMDIPESVSSAIVASVFSNIASAKDAYGFIVSAIITTRRPSKTDHITKQLVMGEMNMDDLKPEDKRASLVTFLTTRDGNGIWINNFLKQNKKGSPQEAILLDSDPDRVELEPAEIMEGDDWKTFYAKSLNFWKAV